MSRSYAKVRPKKHRVYDIQEVMALFSICRNTVANWQKKGLRPSDDHRSPIFRGAELIRFLESRVVAPKLRGLGVFYCFGCKREVVPPVDTLVLSLVESGARRAQARCPDCRGALSKLLDETGYDKLESCRRSNTDLASLAEEMALTPSCIAHSSSEPPIYHTNDRIIHRWQGYAERYDVKTTMAHLTSIRAFEAFIQGKAFRDLRGDEVKEWRTHIMVSAGAGLATSSIRHRVSHLRLFFAWLSRQTKHAHLKAHADYFALPKSFHAAAMPKPRGYPNLEEARAMLGGMPAETLKDRRARAIFALIFVTGFRKTALNSMRLRHVDLVAKRAEHNGREIQAKNGKSFITHFFPHTEDFREEVKAWIAFLQSQGFAPEDALFPPLKPVQKGPFGRKPGPIDPMASTKAIDDAFELACRGRPVKYSPHSARDTLALHGNQKLHTIQQLNAWSTNLGHSSLAVTLRYYAKPDEAQGAEVFEALEAIDPSDQGAPAVTEELTLLLDLYEHRLAPGTPDYERARALQLKRLAKE